MVFVTVGTHEQQFNRLVEKIDMLKKDSIIEDDVVIQIGYSDYEPQYCEWKRFYSFSQMNEYFDKANIIITHGGPSSFIMALQRNKIPLVVPRRVAFDEHVNDHQVDFCHKVKERYGSIIVVDEVEDLSSIISEYSSQVASVKKLIKSNNQQFCLDLQRIVDGLLR